MADHTQYLLLAQCILQVTTMQEGANLLMSWLRRHLFPFVCIVAVIASNSHQVRCWSCNFLCHPEYDVGGSAGDDDRQCDQNCKSSLLLRSNSHN